MNIRDLQYLVAVHDLNNFSKAAERCFVSQPTLSGQLKKLEDELGSELIERSTRQVMFTQLGEEVVRYAREALQTVDQIRTVTKQSGDPMIGDFHIGMIPTVGPFLLPIIMPELSHAYPRANLFLYELRSDELVERLLKGSIDAAILAKLEWEYALIETHLYSEPMQLAVSSLDSERHYDRPVELTVLEGESVLMLDDGHCLRDQALDVCFSAGANEDTGFKATSMDTLLHMVAMGAGMTLVPELVNRKPIQGVRFIPFSNPAPQREIVMLTRKHSARMQALSNIADCIAATVNNVKH